MQQIALRVYRNAMMLGTGDKEARRLMKEAKERLKERRVSHRRLLEDMTTKAATLADGRREDGPRLETTGRMRTAAMGETA